MGSKDFMGLMRSELHRNLPISAAYRYKQPSCTDGSSTVSVNRFASEEMLLGDGEISFRHNITQWEDIVCVATSSAGSSLPLGDWHPATGRINDQTIMGGEPCPSLRLELNRDHPFMWEEKREKRQTELSASLFRELWRLEPLADDWKMRWRMEMEWLLSVSDYIVEFVPSWQTFPDGTTLEVMVSQPRSDLHINLPALRTLDTMLLDSLDDYCMTEFWYVDRGIVIAEKDNLGGPKLSFRRQEEKWWLPTPKVPVNGLSDKARRRLQHQRECMNQILKAAMSINEQVLSEMEVPQVYWDSLPKSAKVSLGDALYRGLSMENFSATQLLSTLDLSSEHSKLEIADRLETAIHVWQRKIQTKLSNLASKSSWVMMKDSIADENKQEQIANRAESLLRCLKQRFPGLTQTALDVNKIQYNKDIGQSILESYSRVLESLASTIISRIDDVIYADDLVRMSTLPLVVHQPSAKKAATCHPKRTKNGSYKALQLPAVATPTHTISPFVSPSTSPSPNSNLIPKKSPHVNPEGTIFIQEPQLTQVLVDLLSTQKLKAEVKQQKEPEDLLKIPPDAITTTHMWSYAGKLENSNALHSPPSRD
ncbi:hypothetical protein BDL97_08G036900 [Sphagnum fallax]|nr:hypothetical protein BDL97_08G036900 [Sphagnum fallax]